MKDLVHKASTHSKVHEELYVDLNGCKYMFDKRFSPELSQLVFKLRTRMYGVKSNFRNQYKEDMLCPLCNTDVDNQSHIFECYILNVNEPSTVVYDELFSSDIDKVYAAAIVVQKLINKREHIINELLNWIWMIIYYC